MPSIKFNYLYRDSGNYKKYGFVIFSNPQNIELSEIDPLIRSELIDGEWFYAEDWRVPEIFLETFDFKTDPTWHQFENVEYSEASENESEDIAAFIMRIKNIKAIY